MSAYVLLKFLHVLAAIVAVGANVTYGVWIARASRDPAHLRYILEGIRVIDSRLANPSYLALLVTGLLMVWASPLRITTPWILTALGLFALIAVLGFAVYSPVLRRQIQAFDAGGPESPAYRGVARRSTRIGAAIAGIVAVIVFLMVTKPALWGG